MSTVTSSSPYLYAAKAPVAATLDNIGIEDALRAVRLRPNVKVNITDSAANIRSYLGALNGIANNIGSINRVESDQTTNTVFALSASQYTSYSKVLAKLDAGDVSYKIAISGVSAATAKSYFDNDANNRFESISVSDRATSIGANVGGLRAILDGGKLGTITNSGPATPISLTRASYEQNKAVLAKIGSAYTIAMTGATAAQAVEYTSNSRIGAISIVDSTGALESNLDALQRLGVRLKTITVDDAGISSDGSAATNGKIDLTASQAKTDALVLGKIYNSYQLAVHGASLMQAGDLRANKKVVSIDIVDRGANIVNSLATLNRLGGQLNSITVTDGDNPLKMSDSQLVSYDTLLGKIAGDYSFDVTGGSALHAQLLLNDTGDYFGAAGAHVHSIAIADTAAHISSVFDGLNGQEKISKVMVLDSRKPIVLTAGQLAAAGTAGGNSVLNKITGGYSLKITGVAAADASGLSGSAGFNSHITAITVADDAVAIRSHLEDLTALGGKLESIVQNDRAASPPMEFDLSFNDWTQNKPTLQKIVGNYSATLSAVSAGMAATVAADYHISAFSVADDGAQIAKNFNALINAQPRLTEVTQSDTAELKASNADASSLTITAAQYVAGAALLDKFAGTGDAAYALSVTGMNVDQVLAIQTSDQIVSATVLDTSGNIAAYLDDLHAQVDSGLVTRITQMGTAASLGITNGQLSADADVLAAITGNYSLVVSGVAAADAASLFADNSHVSSVSVADSAQAVADNLAELKGLGRKLSGITLDGGDGVFALSSSNYASYRTTLDKIAGNYTVELNEVSADQVATLAADTHVTSMAVEDSGAHISTKFDVLKSALGKIEAINGDVATALTLTAAQYALGAGLLAKINYAGSTVNGLTVAAAEAVNASDDNVAYMSVADTSANIAENLDALQANTRVTGIVQSGKASPLVITRQQLIDDADTLAKISGSYSLGVSGVAAATVGDIDGAKDLLANNAHVAWLSVQASAEEISANLADLGHLGIKLVGLEQTDPSVAIGVTDAALTANRTVLSKIDGYRVDVSAVSAARALALFSDFHVSSLDITDSGAKISSYFDALNTVLPKIVGINTPPNGDAPPTTALTLSVNQYAQGGAVLAKIGDYTVGVRGASALDAPTLSADEHVTAVSVKDSSANITENLDDLEANTKLAGITLDDVGVSLNLTAAQKADHPNVLGLIAGSWSMNLSGVAAADAAAADANTHVASFSVASSVAGVMANLDALVASSKLSSISLEVPNSVISIDAAALSTQYSALEKIDNGYSLSVSAATMADLADLSVMDNVTAIQVSDTSLQLSDKFDDLVDLGSTLTAIAVSNPAVPLALTYDQWVSGSSTLGKIADAAYKVDLFDVPAAQVAALSTSGLVDEIYVADNSDNIAGQWEALTNQAKLTSVTVLDNGSITLTLEQQALSGSNELIDKIQGTFSIEDAS